jgi:tetratricopeptide (TPR) repeat protein
MRTMPFLPPLLVGLLALAGCAGQPPTARGEPDTPLQQSAEKGLALLAKGQAKQANAQFNQALARAPADANLHFLNGLSYRQIGDESGQDVSELAETGYRLALEFDPDHWLAAWHLGLLQIEKRQYAEARQSLGKAARLRPRDANIQLALAGAAYQSRDVPVALWAAENTLALRANDPEALRIAALSSAALGLDSGADGFLDRYRRVRPAESEAVEDRVGAWKRLHAQVGAADQHAPVLAANTTDQPSTVSQAPAGAPQGAWSFNWSDCPQTVGGGASVSSSGGAGAGGGSSDATERLGALPSPCRGMSLPRMAVVDVTIIRTQESVQYNQGVNLLQGLGVVLTGNVANTRTTNVDGTRSGSRTFTTGLALPSAIPYTLNIFNTTDQLSDVIARPTLIVLDRTPSTFFSGATVSVAIPGTVSGGSLTDRSVGVSLSVTPTFIDDDHLLLAVKGARSFFEPPPTGVTVTQTVSATNNVVTANVIMKFGETLILSGLRERQNTKGKVGVPVLMDAPILQYLFSTDSDFDYSHHVMITITPRKPSLLNEIASAAQAYVHSPAFQKEDGDVIAAEALGALQSRRPHLEAIMAKLQLSRYRYEFRTGDLSARRFAPRPSLERVLQDIRTMIYF